MTLRDYVRKRRLGETPEPGPDHRAIARMARHRPMFVVQLHHARARHYDFRLEVDGVLRSWAVPKGPSLRVGEKRLAVEVEDHPLSYATFEGDIPAGHYGAGHVDLFDRGTWNSEGDPATAIKAGKLEFELDGHKLQGRWKLVRTAMQGSKTQWLLIKSHDAHARDAEADDLLATVDPSKSNPPKSAPSKPSARKRSVASAAAVVGKKSTRAAQAGPSRWAKLANKLDGAKAGSIPADFKPELAMLRATPPEGDDWLHEVKWDGYRLLAAIEKSEVSLRSRNGLDWTQDFPAIVSALEGLKLEHARFDGELVALDARGRSDFSALQRTIEGSAVHALRYLLFDLLAIDGVDLSGCRLVDRKDLLQRVLEAHPDEALAFSQHVIGHGRFVFDASATQGLEGIVSKRVDSPHAAGRSGDWIKAKHTSSDDFVIVGMTQPSGARRHFGALLMARNERGRLRYVGRVGTGFDDAALKRIHAELKPLVRKQPTLGLPSHIPLRERDVTWLEPRKVAEVAFRGWAKEGLLRQASFLRMRDDKDAADATGDTQVLHGKEDAMEDKTATRITHGDRVVYRAAKITKQQVADYYLAVAPLMLREIAGRPLSIVRCPEGAEKQCFFQKHHSAALGRNVDAIAIKEAGGNSEDYVAVSDVAGVLELVQMNVLEFHPWGCAQGEPERPDQLVFDLDPAEDVAWKDTVKCARDVRKRLQEVGLESFVRLSGGKGLHVVSPIATGPDWDEVKAFCRAFASTMAELHPERYLATASKAQRKGRIFIDWLRNGRGSTSVASWSLRARSGAPVAMPIRWDDLGRVGSAHAYDLQRARKAAARGFDPWESFDRMARKLPGATP